MMIRLFHDHLNSFQFFSYAVPFIRQDIFRTHFKSIFRTHGNTEWFIPFKAQVTFGGDSTFIQVDGSYGTGIPAQSTANTLLFMDYNRSIDLFDCSLWTDGHAGGTFFSTVQTVNWHATDHSLAFLGQIRSHFPHSSQSSGWEISSFIY